ncbi:glycosyltransferase [Halopseudomonas pachastrellae]|nr:glycosyltransferase [Halopseudomonas pachastrellae]
MSRFSAEVLDKYREDIDRVRGQLFGYAAAADTDQCLFSIILTTYNRPAMLVDALRSVAAQTLRDFEVILVNDHGEPVKPCSRNSISAYLSVSRSQSRPVGCA